MKKKITVTKEYVDSLKAQIKNQNNMIEELNNDRNKFRAYFLRLLKDNISMSAKNQHYSTETMINQLAKLLNDVKPWYW